MKLVDKIYSKEDNVCKYVFLRWNSHIVEASYIDNGSGKDIVCVSTHNMCNLGCKFCHCTDYIGKLPIYSLDERDISFIVTTICRDIECKKDTLLISYMGTGEPFNLYFDNTLISSMQNIYLNHRDKYKIIRFGLATCLPKNNIERFFKFCFDVKKHKLNVKLHLSLHFTDNITRKEWMPSSLDIKSSLAACKFYKEYTSNNVEIHYTLIDEVNDTNENISNLIDIQKQYNFNIKFISYNEKDNLEHKKSKIRPILDQCEFYTPPGISIGSSCGQLLFATHKKYLGNL